MGPGGSLNLPLGRLSSSGLVEIATRPPAISSVGSVEFSTKPANVLSPLSEHRPVGVPMLLTKPGVVVRSPSMQSVQGFRSPPYTNAQLPIRANSPATPVVNSRAYPPPQHPVQHHAVQVVRSHSYAH